ncbi:Na-translocating system protein MpsC family protein [Microbacterium sp. APC 3898]|uniref:Na-translocating system protein MpsC family protein n=2 Tax=Planococcus TaxID=1372 RepID=A0ABT7ZJE9_9BACL|nr:MULTISPECIES: Na-translocating system protein MpsC family protein [Terrabacteria group]MDN3427270.1 Na-translocating system protein MpsC family protein [Planococcus sp. APC 4016]MDN3499551.1 Na-translocating system protein MpsC family protein [Microbacterium sp. APC 3898]
MKKEKTTESEVSGYISGLFRTHFGKGPASVFVAIRKPFVVIHLREFLAPTEKVLMSQKESVRVQEIRDLLMRDLKEQIKLDLLKSAELEIKEIHADWNLENKTGLLILVLNGEAEEKAQEWPKDIDKKAFYQEVADASKKAQKEPDKTEVVWLNERTVLIRREGILIEIEKELIRNNFTEQLKLAKRPLEAKLIYNSSLEQLLNRKITEAFTDWDFKDDIGYMVLLIEAKK